METPDKQVPATEPQTCACRKPEPWRSEQINKLCEALAQAQKKIKQPGKSHTAKVASKKGEGSSYSYKYADISDVVKAINEVAADCGLAYTQSLQPNADGRLCIVTMVMHVSGQWISSTYRLPEAESNHDMGGNITYARRYTLAPLFGIAAEEDTDYDGGGHGGGGSGKEDFEKAAEEAKEASRKAMEEFKKGKSTRTKVTPSDKPDPSEEKKPEPEAVSGKAAATEEVCANPPDDFTGIDPRLAKKLQEYPLKGCPLHAFKMYAVKKGHFAEGMDFTKLPEDYIQQILDNWAKIEPSFVRELLPF